MVAKTFETFDDIYELFMRTSRFDEYMLPNTPEGMYSLVSNGIEKYLTFYDNAKEISFDEYSESIVFENEDDAPTFKDAQLIVAYMQLIIYEKIRDEFVSTYDVMVDDIGIRSYRSQVNAKENAIQAQLEKIRKLILKLSDNFDVIDELW